MTGRGRGRGALARWELANKTSGGVEGTSRGGFSAVFPLPKENWEDAVRKSPGDSIKSNTLARVTHIIDVEHFWAQTGSADQLKQFDTYMIALNSWCNEQQRSSVQQVPMCGQPVCVRHTDTGQWRRAQVTRLSDSVVDVFYLDYGQSECVSFDRLCNSTPGDIMSRPPLAQYITLEGVKPVGGRWSEEANSRFSELVSSKLTIHFLDNFRGKLYIRKSNGQDVSVGDVLISEGFAQSSNDSDNRRPWKKEIRSMNTEQQTILEQQWNSLTSPPAQQPSWRTSDHFSTERNQSNNSPFTSRGQYLQKEPVNSNFPAFGNNMLNPSQMFDNESKQNEISLNDIPPPPNPGLRAQNRENDNLEIFHIKRAEHGPVESLRMARPHLASPSEFLTQHRQGHDPGHPHAYSAFPKSESPPKYQPPYLRNSQAKMHETTGMNTEPKLENFTSLTKHNNSAFLPQHVQQQPFSNFSFSPKQGRKQIAAQFQTNPANLGDLPPISHQPSQQTIQSWQQPEFLKTQSLSENTRDKTLKAELEWKIWKFQRNVKKVIDRIATCDVVDCSYELEKLIADSRLSQEFQGISEVSIILKLLLEKVMDKVKFANVAVRVCMIFRDMDIPELGDLLNKVLTDCQQELMEQSSASDCPQRCQRFSSFLGKLYLEVQNESDITGLKSSVDSIVANSLHNWFSFDQADSVVFHSLNAACLMGFLKVTGPTIDQTEGNEISRYFGTIRNLVLSQDLSVPVKSTLLDILLLRASGWKEEDDTDEQETASLSTEDDVFLESENDVTEEEEQLETGDQDDSDEWDPYCKVKSMLKNLKLEDLLQKFFDNCIRDSLLAADWEELKRTLQEAGFPPGVILEIRMYLDKGLLEKDVKKSSKLATDKPTALPADLTVTQELKRASKSPSPTKAMEHNIEINQLNQELQQLLIGGNQDKGGQKISPAKRVSPHRELAGHDTTPYSRAGPRKFVSRAERRRSLESPQEDVSQPITDQENSGFERTVPKPSTPAEPVNTRASAETSSEEQNPATMSYSAVLKTASQEASAKTAPAITKPNQSKTFSRPPPGFPPLPTHGGDAKMNMTVLGSKPKTKPTAPPSSAPWNNTPTRADASANWRNDGREEQFTQSNTRPTNPPQSVQSTARPINQPPPVQSNTRPTHQPPPAQSNTRSSHGVKWRPFDVTVGQSRSPPRSGGGFSEASSQRAPVDTISSAESDESSEPAAQTVVHAHRAFGPGGLKACVICGSKDHLRCNDRSKMFMD